MRKFKLGIIGAGNMASAILNGILKSRILGCGDIVISDVDDVKLSKFADLGIATTKDNCALIESSNYILLAVKPQIAKTILPDLKQYAQNKNIISIMAGISKDTIKSMLGNVQVTRIMPNTPCLVGEGMCAVDAADFDKDGKMLVTDIFGSLGSVIELPETYFHAVTSLSGSGPAYVYMFIEALIKGGVNSGLSEETAKKLALQTVRGAATMVEESNNIDVLVKNVCSPGGTTIEAVNYYKEARLEEIVEEGMERCKKKSEELSNNAR